MIKMAIRRNIVKRAEIIQKMVNERYEPENRSKCKVQIYRTVISENYPMSLRTFWRYVNMDLGKSNKEST